MFRSIPSPALDAERHVRRPSFRGTRSRRGSCSSGTGTSLEVPRVPLRRPAAGGELAGLGVARPEHRLRCLVEVGERAVGVDHERGRRQTRGQIAREDEDQVSLPVVVRHGATVCGLARTRHPAWAWRVSMVEPAEGASEEHVEPRDRAGRRHGCVRAAHRGSGRRSAAAPAAPEGAGALFGAFFSRAQPTGPDRRAAVTSFDSLDRAADRDGARLLPVGRGVADGR